MSSQELPIVATVEAADRSIVVFTDGRKLAFDPLGPPSSPRGVRTVVLYGKGDTNLVTFYGQDEVPQSQDFSLTSIGGGFDLRRFKDYWQAAVFHLENPDLESKKEGPGCAHARAIVLHPVTRVCFRLVELDRCGFRA